MSKITTLYNTLIQNNVINSQGITTFELNGVLANIKGPDSVGNLIQEWLETFMTNSNISYRVKTNSQEFPDFLMHDDDDTKELLEIKCFQGSAGFDLSKFDAYIRSLLDHPYRLDAKYLIFKYCKTNQGIQIKNIWLKNIWEITGASERFAVKIHRPHSKLLNIRPITWTSRRTTAFKPFTSRRAFVEALNTVIQSAEADVEAKIKNNWLKRVSDEYREYAQQDL